MNTKQQFAHICTSELIAMQCSGQGTKEIRTELERRMSIDGYGSKDKRRKKKN